MNFLKKSLRCAFHPPKPSRIVKKALKKSVRRALHPPEIIGWQGETAAALRLGWVSFCGYPGKVVRNLYVPSGRGHTTEIDLLYITQKGIYVVESKNYSGYIFGSESQKTWTGTLYTGKDCFGRSKVEKHHFYNPIWQNQAHISALRKFLPYEVPLWSVVVFSDHCQLKQITVNDPYVIVCQQAALPAAIRRIWHSSVDVFSTEEVETVEQLLLPLTNPDAATKAEHVRDVEARQNPDSTIPAVCPRCGGKLVLRTARKGPHAGQQFYGCSNYPSCHYTHNI